MDPNIQESEYPQLQEVDPTGRYGRYNEILGKGASKIVYRGFDEYEGVEVAWNQVRLNDFLQSPEDLERLYCEIHLLKTLKHKNIMKFNTSWVDISKRKINFVTEMFTSGTLRQYRRKHRRVHIRAMKHWCRQILSGLLYLHSHVPPIIHRDLKCDNIFVNGNEGQVKIGDMGLAAILRKPHADHCVGTPEFMAPEVYKESYNELVDIYSFGMCVLEMVTFEYPYSECTHPAQIYKKVICGRKPNALYKVQDPEIRRFVEKCIAAVSKRPSARELLNDPFLQIDDPGMDLREGDTMQPYHSSFQSDGFSNTSRLSVEDLPYDVMLENGWDWNNIEIEGNRLDSLHSPACESHTDLEISIKGMRKNDGSIFLRLRISDREGHVRNIYFRFEIENDTALGVASEMVAELNITDHDVAKIAGMIDGEVSSLIPEWKPTLDVQGSMQSSLSNKHELDVLSTSSLVNYLSITNDSGNGNIDCAQHGRFGEITYHVKDSTESRGLSSSNSIDEKNGHIEQVDSDDHDEIGTASVCGCLDSFDFNELKLQDGNSLQALKSFHYGTSFSYQIPSVDVHDDASKTNISKKFAKEGNSESEHTFEERNIPSLVHSPKVFSAWPFQWFM